MQRERSLPFIQHVNKFLGRFPELTYDGSVISCSVCQMNFVGWSAYNCKRHVTSAAHIKNRKLQWPYNVFLYDFIYTLSVCNIPQHVLDKSQFRVFWKKYVPYWPLPTNRQVRQKFPQVKQQLEDIIKFELHQMPLWVTIVETIDLKNNKMAHVLVRGLHPDKPSPVFLLASKKFNSTSETIKELVVNTLNKFNIENHNVLMLVTDGTVHMLEAGALLKQTYSNLIHITCIIHTFYLVAEKIRRYFCNLDKLVTSTNMMFVKSAKHVSAFGRDCPKIPYPPKPVVTRWGTWLQSAFYYVKYFEEIKSLVYSLDPNASTVVKDSQQLFSKEEVKDELQKISDYSILNEAIEKLQDGSLALCESFEIVGRVNLALQARTDDPISKNFVELLQSNQEFLQLHQDISEEDSNELYRYLAFAPVTCLDLEKILSKYTSTFTAKRSSLLENTIEGLLMMQLYAESHKGMLMNTEK